MTDEHGGVLWRARYHPFGRPTIQEQRAGFTLDLRLPGQLEDEETGLFYNDHRYYDPDTGRYVSPDPLGLRGGINSYAYAGGNPLRFIDPSGLLLFAFDGTNNSNPAMDGSTLSNVVKFRNAYIGNAYYITGIGTTDDYVTYKGSDKSGDGIDQRLDKAFEFLGEYIEANNDTDALQIDVIGFSRGATTARAWLNQLRSKMVDGGLYFGDKFRCIEFNFAGLWDTVPHLGLRNENEKNYDFSIPKELKFAAHAVALNEHRGSLINFHGRSILENAQAKEVANRIERGFLGAHSDIGGSYRTGDLSDIALMWMIEQAKNNGLTFDEDIIREGKWDAVTEPLLHNSANLPVGYGLDRDIVYEDGSKIRQRDKKDAGGMTYTDTLPFISMTVVGSDLDSVTGDVDLGAYCKWLNSNKYFKMDTVCASSGV